MWPRKPIKVIQANRTAVPIQNQMTKKLRIVPQGDDKNCQSTNYFGLMCADKKCQADKTVKHVL